jgi:hypothetical protein
VLPALTLSPPPARVRVYVRELESVASDAATDGSVFSELGHRIVLADHVVLA